MRCLVLGGGGHLGAAFCHHLASAQHDVVALGRRDTRPESLADITRLHYQPVAMEGTHRDAQLDGYDLIVDAAAPYALEEDALDAALTRGQTILDACARNRSTLVHVGSFTVHTDADGLTGRALARLHPYFTLKRRLESQVLEADVDSVIINPTQALGPWDGRALPFALLPLLIREKIPFTANQRLNVIDVRDVAAAGIAAATRRQFRQPILLAGHNVTLDLLFSRVAEMTGTRPPRWHASAEAGAVLAFGAERMQRLLPRAAHYPSLGFVLLLSQQWLFPGPLQRRLGLPITSLTKTLTDSLAWYAQRADLSAALPPAR